MIIARIQAHPSRNGLHDRLKRLLSPLPTELFVHQSDPPDPWSGYKRCLTDIPSEVRHLLVVQDDAIPVAGFAAAVGRIAERHPNDPVCLFMGALPASTATLVRRAKPDVRYVPLMPAAFMPLICVLWPADVARSFLTWTETARGMSRGDDNNAGRWYRSCSRRQQVWVTVPSLVRHDDGQPSVKGGRAHTPWAESWRQALFLAANGDDYEW